MAQKIHEMEQNVDLYICSLALSFNKISNIA